MIDNSVRYSQGQWLIMMVMIKNDCNISPKKEKKLRSQRFKGMFDHFFKKSSRSWAVTCARGMVGRLGGKMVFCRWEYELIAQLVECLTGHRWCGGLSFRESFSRSKGDIRVRPELDHNP